MAKALSKTRRNGDAAEVGFGVVSSEAVECELIQLSDAGLKGFSRLRGLQLLEMFKKVLSCQKAVPTRVCAC